MQQLKSALAHTDAAEAKRIKTLHKNNVLHKATEAQRERLRISSINDRAPVSYTKRRLPDDELEGDRPPAKRRRTDPNFATRLEAVQHRLKSHRPNRFNVKAWEKWHKKSIAVLQPYYKTSTRLILPPCCPFSALPQLTSIKSALLPREFGLMIVLYDFQFRRYALPSRRRCPKMSSGRTTRPDCFCTLLASKSSTSILMII